VQFQRRDDEIEVARDDARARGIRDGDTVTVSSNGTSLQLRARISRELRAGTVRIARDTATDLHPTVEVSA
jgi:anaerobic selenocysteine-containing dehydrogenase